MEETLPCLHAPLPPSSTIHFYESVEVYLGLLTIATREGVKLHVNMKWNCQRVISSHKEWKENDDEVNSHFSHNKLLLTGVHCAIMSFLLFPILWQCSNDITFTLCVCIYGWVWGREHHTMEPGFIGKLWMVLFSCGRWGDRRRDIICLEICCFAGCEIVYKLFSRWTFFSKAVWIRTILALALFDVWRSTSHRTKSFLEFSHTSFTTQLLASTLCDQVNDNFTVQWFMIRVALSLSPSHLSFHSPLNNNRKWEEEKKLSVSRFFCPSAPLIT